MYKYIDLHALRTVVNVCAPRPSMYLWVKSVTSRRTEQSSCDRQREFTERAGGDALCPSHVIVTLAHNDVLLFSCATYDSCYKMQSKNIPFANSVFICGSGLTVIDNQL